MIDAAKFWAKVRTGNPEECWEWVLAAGTGKHGQFRQGRTGYPGALRIYAHRVAFMLANPDVSIDGLCICHRCDNPPCCNPAHLFVGTQADNVKDCAQKGRTPHGQRHWNAKLTDEQVRLIKADGRKGREVAAAFGVSEQTISSIRRGRRHAKARAA